MAHRMIATKPRICLLSNGGIEKPCRSIHKLRVFGGVAMQLAVLVGDRMLVAKVPCIDTHANPLKPGILLSLLSSITVCVVKDVFRFLGTWYRECIFEHNKEVGYHLCPKQGSTSKDDTTRSDQLLFIMRSMPSKLSLDRSISSHGL